MATSTASVTTDTTNFTRIHLILMKGGTLLTKTLFLKCVKDLSPAGHELTVDEFLGKHRVQILSTSTGRNNEEKLYPPTGTSTNLEEWDLPLYCFILKTVCRLPVINKLDMNNLKTMRNELSHLHDPSLTDADFKIRLSIIEPIFTRSLQIIKDPLFEAEMKTLLQRCETGALAVDEVVKVYHDSSRKHIELLSNQVKMMKIQADMKLNQGVMLQNQASQATDMATALSMLKKIDDKLPPGSDVEIQDVHVIIEVKNCTRDKEQELLEFLVKQFNETISKPECNLTKDFPNLAMHTISEAICKTLKDFLAKGRHVLKVENGSIALTVKCKSISSFVDLISDSLDGSLLYQLGSLKDALRSWDGCEGVDLEPAISPDEITSVILKLAKDLDKKLPGEDLNVGQLLPMEQPLAERDGSSTPQDTYPLCLTGSSLKLTIKPDTKEQRKEIESNFIGSLTEGFEQFQNELRKDPDFRNVVIETKLLASDNFSKLSENSQESIAFVPQQQLNRNLRTNADESTLLRQHEETLTTDDERSESDLPGNEGSQLLYRKEEKGTARGQGSSITPGIHRENSPFAMASKLKSQSGHIAVAAMDFGTTYSGYAYSLIHEYETDPTKVFAHTKWVAGSQQLISLKTPSILLLNPDKTFKSFGYEAENDYCDLAADGKHKDYYYFRRFKMLLYESTSLKRDMVIEDDKKKKLKAILVFSHSIKYLKDHMLSSIQTKFPEIKERDICWVLTVPAIWSDGSKQFMREAAQQAGIKSDSLIIALEPEAASLFCMHLPVDKMSVEGKVDASSAQISPFQPGTKYMVVDVGGGTVDITIHQVIDKDKLKEINFASGGAWGGTMVDEAFKDFLIRLVGKNVYDKFVDECKEDLVHLYREFETKKRNITIDKDGKETMKIPIALVETYEDVNNKKLKDVVATMKEFRDKVTVTGDKLRVDAAIMRSWFDLSTRKTVEHVKKLFRQKNAKDVNTILLVGGFSESPMLQDAMRKNFKDKRLIIPEDAGLVVLKGAVIFGHNPVTIVSRIAKFSYGVRVYRDFIPGSHPDDKKLKVGDKWKCKDVFACHVKKGQELVVGEAQTNQRYTPLEADQMSLIFDVYTSPEEDPQYVTDPGCLNVGQLEVELPDLSGGKERGVWVQMIFGGTEVVVEAKEEKSGKITKVDFLQDTNQYSDEA